MGIVQTWDTHVANFPRLRDELLPPLDRAVSALLDDLAARGLLDETLVVMLGEFGRTPRISRADARRRPRPRPLAVRLPGRLRRRGRGRRPGHRQVRPAGRLSGHPFLRPARPGRDHLPRPRRRPGHRAPRPPRPSDPALLGPGHRSDLFSRIGLIRTDLAHACRIRFSPWKGRGIESSRSATGSVVRSSLRMLRPR